MDTLTIGVLSPSSTIFPISKDFENGLKEGLKSLNQEGIDIQLVKEFIAQGDGKLIENACSKFFSFDDADIITGVLSVKAAGIIAERFKKQQKPLIVNELGSNIPEVDLLNEYVFVNSPHLWQHAYALGNWGVKNIGKKGMFIGAVYDAGYAFSQMFYEGMMAAGAQPRDWSFSVAPMPPAGQLSTFDVIFPYLEEYKPDFIFAAFCGAETTLFLNEFIARGWHHKTKVLGLPYLLAPFEPLNDDITIYTTLPFGDLPDITPAGAFYQLGLQTGKNIADAAKATTGRIELKSEFAKQNRMFSTALNADHPATPIVIIENTIKSGVTEFISKSLTQSPFISMAPAVLAPLTQGVSSGWFNPYLCI